MIRKIGRKYVVLSDSTGRRFGAYETRAEAEARLRQLEMFKHMKKRSARATARHPRA